MRIPKSDRKHGSPIIIFLRSRDFPAPEVVLADYRRRWPQSPITADSLTERLVAFCADGTACSAVFVPEAVPEDLMRGVGLVTWHWPDALGQIARHRAGVTVFPTARGNSTVEAALGLTRIVASLVSTTDAIGVYWTRAVLKQAEVFLEWTERAGQGCLPLPLWIGCYFICDTDGRNKVMTLGMHYFGRHEIAFPFDGRINLDYVNLVYSFARFVLTSDHSLPEGFVLKGKTETRRIHYRESEFGLPPVMELEPI